MGTFKNCSPFAITGWYFQPVNLGYPSNRHSARPYFRDDAGSGHVHLPHGSMSTAWDIWKGKNVFDIMHTSGCPFSMLGLLMSSNIFPDVYVLGTGGAFILPCWIGFYYEKPMAVAACKKAFIVPICRSRFLLGILILSNQSRYARFNSMIDTLGKPGICKTCQGHFMGLSALNWGLAGIHWRGGKRVPCSPAYGFPMPWRFTPVSALIHTLYNGGGGCILVARLAFPHILQWLLRRDLLNMVAGGWCDLSIRQLLYRLYTNRYQTGRLPTASPDRVL